MHPQRYDHPAPTILVDILANKWSLLVIEEAFRGTTRFNRFEEKLGIAGKSLSRCLDLLIKAGLLTRKPCTDSPRHQEYRLTKRGKSIWPALTSLSGWSRRRLGDNGCTTQQIMAFTGHTTPAEVERYTKMADRKRLACAVQSMPSTKKAQNQGAG